MRLYNTLTRTVEPFAPLAPPAVTMYVCGPTVYDEPHLGHVRSAFVFDVLRRWLARSYQVRFVRNVTDVDDKIIDRARKEATAGADLNEACRQTSQRYLGRYHEALDRLGIARPDVEPRATDHVVPEMTDLISKLILDNVAYQSGGDVYFSVRKFPAYGRLSNRTLDELQAGARVEPGEQKQDPLDFALWKAAKPDEPLWNSPFGPGRPGWHIECSAMSTKYLGERFDIHGGGLDLIFPHHENEVAQAQAAGKAFANWWVHHGLVTVNGEKMSKSLGNFVTVEQALKQCDEDPDVLKLFFLLGHYRSPLDYTSASLQIAKGMLSRISEFIMLAARTTPLDEGALEGMVKPELKQEIEVLLKQFESSLDNDLHTPTALAAIFGIIGIVNGAVTSRPPSLMGEIAALQFGSGRIKVLLRQAFGLVLQLKLVLNETISIKSQLSISRLTEPVHPAEVQISSIGLSDEERERILPMALEREAARRRKDFKCADEIRDALAKEGFIIEDASTGPVIKRK